ncbi:MAG: type II toxin-antitoxin system death-on-curing family toxin [Saprospiraceae bacterium]|nr:type II toxin-antitoxin system death-on-curing family toxin [Saprospiraceae bacterium]
MKLLTKQNIITFNKATVQTHGGNYTPPYNLLNESNLDYLIDAIDGEMFGEPLYPNLSDKAAVYLFNIVCNHIFMDGNKRTGLMSATIFLQSNGYDLNFNLSDKVIENFVLKVASGESDLNECREWFKQNIVEI